MKFNYQLPIDLLEFLKSGKFDCVKLGQTKQSILLDFPDPDCCWEGREPIDPKCIIWKYGDFEFYFDEMAQSLYMIHFDGFNIPDGDQNWFTHEVQAGNSFKLTRWIFDNPAQLNLPFVMNAFIENKMDFCVNRNKQGSVELTIEKSRVKLIFSKPGEKELSPEYFRCIAVSLSIY